MDPGWWFNRAIYISMGHLYHGELLDITRGYIYSMIYPPVNVYITMERSTILHGKI